MENHTFTTNTTYSFPGTNAKRKTAEVEFLLHSREKQTSCLIPNITNITGDLGFEFIGVEVHQWLCQNEVVSILTIVLYFRSRRWERKLRLY